MKKIIKNLLAVIFCIIFCVMLFGGCTTEKSYQNNGTQHDNQQNNEQQNEKKDLNNSVSKIYGQYTIHSGYIHELPDSENKKIISSYSQLLEYVERYGDEVFNEKMEVVDNKLSKLISNYNDEYFKNKSIALIYVSVPCCNAKIIFDDPIIDGNKLVVKYEIESPEIGLYAMGGSIFVVEIDKDITIIE